MATCAAHPPERPAPVGGAGALERVGVDRQEAASSSPAWRASSTPEAGSPRARRPAPLTSEPSSIWRGAAARAICAASAAARVGLGRQVDLVPQHHDRDVPGLLGLGGELGRAGRADPARGDAHRQPRGLEGVRARAHGHHARAAPARLAGPQLHHRLLVGRVAADDHHEAGAVDVAELRRRQRAQGRERAARECRGAARARRPAAAAASSWAMKPSSTVAVGPTRTPTGPACAQHQRGRVHRVVQAHLAGAARVADDRLASGGRARGRRVVREAAEVAEPALLHLVVRQSAGRSRGPPSPRARSAPRCSPRGSGRRPTGRSRCPRAARRSGRGCS